MEEALRIALLEAAALAALVQRRVDWHARPQGDALPAVVLRAVSGVPQMTMDGPCGWTKSRVQIDCWARTHKVARDAGDLVVGVLHGLRVTIGDVRVRAFAVSRRGDTDTDTAGIIHRASIDVLVWHH